MLVEGVHFSSEIDPFSLGKRVLAVNLSDLAAMGACLWVYSWIRFECIKFVMVACLFEGLV